MAWLDDLFARLLHVHEWECTDEVEDDWGKEQYWYWHIERCVGCDKRIMVMNHGREL